MNFPLSGFANAKIQKYSKSDKIVKKLRNVIIIKLHEFIYKYKYI